MRKPKKKYPSYMIYDIKHRKWIDMRCNNPKLKKLKDESVPVLLTTPFNTIKPKELSFERYPHIPILETNARVRRSLLGLRLQWTIKHDGQNVTIWLKKKKYAKNSSSLYTGLVSLPKGFEIVISSHNQENAASDIVACVQGAEEYQKILKLITDNPSFRVVVEECAKGASITGIRRYARAILYVVDIFDTAINNFLSYTQVYQNCYHYGIPVVELYATTRHRTIKDLRKFSNHVLEYCNTEKDYGKDEGMVAKGFNKDGEYLMAKVKLDCPRPIIERVREGKPIYPVMPDGEVYNSISKVETDYGLKSLPKIDMPLIARYIEEAMKQHFYSKPKQNYFYYYQEFLQRRVNHKV